MPSRITPQQYGQAVLEHAQTASYPEDEDVVSAELQPSALPEVSRFIGQAREDVQHDIRQISRSCASDIDGWIVQAKTLRVDIQSSHNTANEIVRLAQHGDRLDEETADAAGKVHLLNGELMFNGSLIETLERLQTLGQTLDSIQGAIVDNRPLEAVKLLRDINQQLPSPSTLGAARISDVFGSKIAEFREGITEELTKYWNGYISVNDGMSSIVIRRQSMHTDAPALESIAQALSELKMFDIVLLPLSQDIERLILLPRLQVRSGGTVAKLVISNDGVCAEEQTPDLSAQSLFQDLNEMIDFFQDRLPESILEPLADQLIPLLVHKLIAIWLASSVPENLEGMEDFQGTMDLANTFANKLREFKWPGTRELADWMGSIPDIWLRKRQEISLSQVRKLLSKGFGAIENVERVETQVLDQDDQILKGDRAADEWNADWSDDDPDSPVSTLSEAVAQQDDSGDVSAWGLDDDKHVLGDPHSEDAGGHVKDEADAWGWNEDDDDGEPKSPTDTMEAAPKGPKSNGAPKSGQKSERAVTLKETYNITSLPKEVLSIISQVISDASTLESPSQVSFPVASAAPELLSLPSLILAMYRASASSTYTFRPNGSMFLYNDSLWLGEQLRHMLEDLQQTTASRTRIHSRTSYNLNLKAQIAALESYGKRAYAKEMESQRTILTDLLDGAQGFCKCATHPFNHECEIAIASTVDRLRLLHKEWNLILSPSALLQSLGSLLTTVTSKMIMDIEDISNISVPESQQLAKFCGRIAALENLFVPQVHESDEQAVPATAFYVPNWFKFQYLTNILEGSMADIKYMWTESDLSLDFRTDELVELIIALFEDNEMRRKTIGEIRLHKR